MVVLRAAGHPGALGDTAQLYPAQAHRQQGRWLDTCLIWSPGGNISPQGFNIFQYKNLFWGSTNVNTDKVMFEVNQKEIIIK